MANTQIPKSSAPVVLTLVAGAGAGTTVPVFSGSANFNIWFGGTKVVADTLVGTLPVTVNGFTISAATTNAAAAYATLTLSIASTTTLAAATGYIIDINYGSGNASSGVFDIPVAWGYTASGASLAAVNGNYIPVTGANATLNSATQYTNGTYFLGYTGTTWLIDTTINNGATPTCGSPTAGANATNVPASGWSGSPGCTTPPIFTGITTTSAFTLTSAGTAAANGTYVPVVGASAVLNSAVQYTNTVDFLAFSTIPAAPGQQWMVQTVVNGTYASSPLYTSGSGTATAFPLTAWGIGSGVAPVPTFTPSGTFLVVPTTPTMTAAGNLQMTANIGNAASEPVGTTYSILRGTTAGGESATPFQTGITTFPYVFTESAPGTYFYKITATSGGVTTTSAEVSATAIYQQLIKGGAVGVVNLLPGTGSGTTLVYGGTTCFNLWQAGVQVIPLTTIATLPVTVNGFTVSAQTIATGQAVPPAITNLSIAIASSSTLAVANGYIINAYSSGGVATTGAFDLQAAAAATLVVPTSPTVTAGASLQMTANISNAASEPSGTTYSILRGTTTGAESATAFKTGITAFPYVFTESAAGTYFYQITATSGGTTTAASIEVSATVTAWGYTVANAGSTSANGNYIPVTGANATSQGAPQYFNGTNYLAYTTSPGSPEWLISSTLNASYNSPGILYYNGTAVSTTGPSLTGWLVSSGTAPVPTLTAISTTTAYTTSNAGTAAANGNYVPVTGANATFGGATQYTNGTDFLTFISTGPSWYIQVTASTNAIPQYSVTAGATATNIPLTGWGTAQGTAPAPTFTAVGIAVATPSALTSFAVVLADSGTAPSPTLSWVLPASGTAYTGFNVRRGTAAAGESATPLNASPLAAGVLSYIDTTAAYATDYYYVVDGLWASGTVTTSELHIKTDTAAPTSLAATFGNSQVALTWVNATGALGVIVERTPQSANTWTTITTIASPVTSFTDSTVVNGTAYSFRVRNLD